jgi:hypothetical protein
MTKTLRTMKAKRASQPAKPWIAEAQQAGRQVPAWIAERASTRDEFEQLLALRERAFPATRPAQAAQLSVADGEQLERVNQALASRNLMVMQEDDGKFSLYRIERGAVAMHGPRYDRYVKLGGLNVSTLAQVEAAVREVVEGKR